MEHVGMEKGRLRSQELPQAGPDGFRFRVDPEADPGLTWELWKEDTQEWVPFDQPVNVGEVGETKDKIAEVISKNARTRNLHGKQAKVSETLAPDTDRAPMRDRTLSDEHMAIANSPDEARALAQLEAYRVAMMFQKVSLDKQNVARFKYMDLQQVQVPEVREDGEAA